MQTLPAPTRTAPSRGVRMGWIRRPAASPGPWPGDATRGAWYRAPELPAWINGRARSKLITSLAFAEVSLLLLGVCYALMSLPS